MVAGSSRYPSVRAEVTGVAGAGKSSLVAALGANRRDARFAPQPRLRSLSHWPYVIHSIPQLASHLVRGIRRGRVVGRTDVKLLIYLTEWDRYLERKEFAGRVVLLDQGPVYAMARLAATRYATGMPLSWQTRTVERWSAALDLVVWLDAPDETLWERINTRERHHEVRGASEEAGRRFIRGYRAAFEDVMELLDGKGGPSVLRYDTNERSIEEIVRSVDAHLPGGTGA